MRPLPDEMKVTNADFSVIITSHNQSAFIGDAIDSALSQWCPAREVIVVDDASSDDSRRILAKYKSRIVLVNTDENRGATVARNMGAATSRGSYLVFLDGDDVMFPWALETYNRIVSLKSPKLILSSLFFFCGPVPAFPMVGPRTIQYYAYKNLIKKDRSYRASASAIVVERRTFMDAGGWTEGIFPMEDLDLIVKLGYSGDTIQIVSPATKCYRLHSGNTVQQVLRCMDMMAMLAEKERRCEYPGPRDGRFERYAFLGGPAWFWVKKGISGGFYAQSLELLSRTWPMILAGVCNRTNQVVQGKRPLESITVDSALATS